MVTTDTLNWTTDSKASSCSKGLPAQTPVPSSGGVAPPFACRELNRDSPVLTFWSTPPSASPDSWADYDNLHGEPCPRGCQHPGLYGRTTLPADLWRDQVRAVGKSSR